MQTPMRPRGCTCPRKTEVGAAARALLGGCVEAERSAGRASCAAGRAAFRRVQGVAAATWSRLGCSELSTAAAAATVPCRPALRCTTRFNLHPAFLSLSPPRYPAGEQHQLTVADVNQMALHAEGQWAADEEGELARVISDREYRAVSKGGRLRQCVRAVRARQRGQGAVQLLLSWLGRRRSCAAQRCRHVRAALHAPHTSAPLRVRPPLLQEKMGAVWGDWDVSHNRFAPVAAYMKVGRGRGAAEGAGRARVNLRYSLRVALPAEVLCLPPPSARLQRTIADVRSKVRQLQGTAEPAAATAVAAAGTTGEHPSRRGRVAGLVQSGPACCTLCCCCCCCCCCMPRLPQAPSGSPDPCCLAPAAPPCSRRPAGATRLLGNSGSRGGSAPRRHGAGHSGRAAAAGGARRAARGGAWRAGNDGRDGVSWLHWQVLRMDAWGGPLQRWCSSRRRGAASAGHM